MLLYGATLLALVPISLSPEQQGIWFTMMSLGALSRLADMGFLSLVLTFVGHSKKQQPAYNFDMVLLFTSYWRSRVILLVYPLIFIVGFLVLTRNDQASYSMAINWGLYVVSLILLFVSFHKIAVLEGLGLVIQAHLFKGLIYALAAVITSLLLWFNSGLYALGLGLLIALLPVMFFLFSYQYKKPGEAESKKSLNDLKSVFFKLIKKTALSWTGGYIGLHGIVPIAYLLLGSIASGVVGLTLNIFIALQNVANSFLVAKVPLATHLMADKNYQKVYLLLLSNAKKSLLLFTLSSIFFWGLFYFFFATLYEGRVLQGAHLVILYLSFLCQIMISAIAIYFRAKKQEPFANLSIVSGLLMVVIMVFSIKVIQTEFYLLGFLVSSLFALIWAFILYFKRVDE